MLVVVKQQFHDLKTGQTREPFEFMEVDEKRAQDLTARNLAVKVPQSKPEPKPIKFKKEVK